MHSLNSRLMASFGLVIMVIISSSIFLAYRATYNELNALAERVAESQDKRIESELTIYYRMTNTWDGIQPYLVQWANLYGRRIMITNAEGIVVGDSTTELIGVAYTDDNSGTPIQPFMAFGTDVGKVHVMKSDATDINMASLGIAFNSIGRYFIWGGLLAAFFALILTSILSRRILAPIKDLTHAARRFGKGDFSQKVDERSSSELGELSRSFNSMARELEYTEKLRRNMVADIAHELRTPISNLKGYLEAIGDGVVKPDEETIHSLTEEANSLSRLVNELQELSLADAGVLKLNIQPFDIGTLAADTVMALQPNAQKHNVTLSAEIPEELPEVNIDPHRIRQVMVNLLNNAIVHTPSGGNVTLSVEKTSRSTTVTVSDTGEGIPEEDLPKIFERFYRVDKSRTRTTGGSGLGLTIAKRFVEAHGGTIDVTSIQGSGTTFRFIIPES